MYNQYFTPDAAPVNPETVRAELPEKIRKYIHHTSVNWHALELSTSLKTFTGASVENVFDNFHGPTTTFSIDGPQPGSRLESPYSA